MGRELKEVATVISDCLMGKLKFMVWFEQGNASDLSYLYHYDKDHVHIDLPPHYLIGCTKQSRNFLPNPIHTYTLLFLRYIWAKTHIPRLFKENVISIKNQFLHPQIRLRYKYMQKIQRPWLLALAHIRYTSIFERIKC